MKAAPLRKVLLVIALIVTLPGVSTAGDRCSTCHRGIEDAHPKRTLACTTCHRGGSTAKDVEKAHAGMRKNPSDLRVLDATCGRCHKTITGAVKTSIMAPSVGYSERHALPQWPPSNPRRRAVCDDAGARDAIRAPAEGTAAATGRRRQARAHAHVRPERRGLFRSPPQGVHFVPPVEPRQGAQGELLWHRGSWAASV
jgi:hypothetical protein